MAANIGTQIDVVIFNKLNAVAEGIDRLDQLSCIVDCGGDAFVFSAYYSLQTYFLDRLQADQELLRLLIADTIVPLVKDIKNIKLEGV